MAGKKPIRNPETFCIVKLARSVPDQEGPGKKCLQNLCIYFSTLRFTAVVGVRSCKAHRPEVPRIVCRPAREGRKWASMILNESFPGSVPEECKI
jgi:hypothetical protein